MNIGTLLDHTSSADKEALLRSFLAYTFRGEDGEIDPETKTRKEPVEFMRGLVAAAIATAEKRLAILDELDYIDDELDDIIHDQFSVAASDVNNDGTAAQHLVVEWGWTAKEVRDAAGELNDEEG